MKAAVFDYTRPATLAEAFLLLGQHGPDAKLLAGGQSLLPALNLRLSAPRMLIDIGRIAELRGIEVIGERLYVGALTTHAELAGSPVIARHAGLIARAVGHIAHPAIRNRGTIGGSLANADPAAELPAVMLALDARIILANRHGRRAVAAAEFFTGLFETVIDAEEILVAVEIDIDQPASRSSFHELARRGGDYALVGLAAQAHLRDAGFGALRIAYFAVGSVPVLARHAAAALTGRPLDAVSLDAAAAALSRDLQPHDDLQAGAAMRLRLAAVLLRRAVAGLVAGSR